MTTEKSEHEKDVAARAAAQRLASLNTKGAAFQALDGYPDSDVGSGPSLTDAEAGTTTNHRSEP